MARHRLRAGTTLAETPRMSRTTLLLALVSGLLGAVAIAHADGKKKPPPCHPPPAAVDACADKAAGDACSFDGPDGTITGTCFKPDDAPADAPLACAPQSR
jgi:hypothetical protein